MVEQVIEPPPYAVRINLEHSSHNVWCLMYLVFSQALSDTVVMRYLLLGKMNAR